MANWPAAPFPQELIETGYSESPPNNLLRTNMDVGPAKVRKRTLANVRSISGQMTLTAAQVATLDTFFVTTTNYGADAFTWVNPRTGVTATIRFVNPPAYTSLEGGMYSVALSLEILP
jgi:hypothetical protein